MWGYLTKSTSHKLSFKRDFRYQGYWVCQKAFYNGYMAEFAEIAKEQGFHLFACSIKMTSIGFVVGYTSV